MAWDAFEKAKTSAGKILGPSADVPKEKVDFEKLRKVIVDAYSKIDKLKDDLEASLLQCEDAISAATNAMKQTTAIYEKADFGLDSKKKDDLKKIVQARQMISGVLKTGLSNLASRNKDLDELGKHAIQMSKYKSPTDIMK